MFNDIGIENILLIASVLLLLGVLASKASARLSVPALALFLVVGMLAGSEGLGGIPYDDPASAQFLGVLALVFTFFFGFNKTGGSPDPVRLGPWAAGFAGAAGSKPKSQT